MRRLLSAFFAAWLALSPIAASAQMLTLGVGGSGFYPNGVSFTATQNLAKSGAYTSIADSKVGTISFWFWMKGGDGVGQAFTDILNSGPTARLNLSRRDFGTLKFIARDSTSTTIMDVESSGTYTSTMTGWAHVISAWDLAASSCQLYVNGVSVLSGGSCTNATIDYNPTTPLENVTGNNLSSGGTQPLNAYIAEFYLNTDAALLPSNAANLAKFYNAGRPVPLGTNCADPSGSQPVLCLRGGASEFVSNAGYGGALTLTGTLTTVAGP